MDLISLYQYGIKIAVATLGTALTSQQARLIKRYADNVIISYDSDGPGTKASLRAIDILVEAGLSVKVLDLKDAKDPDEYVRKYGTDEYRNAMKDAVPRIKFKIDNLKSTFDLSKDQDNIKFAQEAVNIIKQLKSPVEIDYYIKYLSEIVQLDEDAVKREIYGKSYSSKNLSNGKFNNKFNKKEEKPIEKMDAIQHGEELTEIMLIKIMMIIPAAREKILLKIDEKELLMEDSKKILNYLSKIDSEKIVEPDELEGINDEYIKSLKKTSLESINIKNMKEIEETVRSVRRNSLKKTIDNLRIKQEELGAKSKILAESDKEAAKELDLEIMNLALQSVDLNKRLRNL